MTITSKKTFDIRIQTHNQLPLSTKLEQGSNTTCWGSLKSVESNNKRPKHRIFTKNRKASYTNYFFIISNIYLIHNPCSIDESRIQHTIAGRNIFISEMCLAKRRDCMCTCVNSWRILVLYSTLWVCCVLSVIILSQRFDSTKVWET